MKDVVAVALLLVTFATLVTVHVSIALSLARRRPRWRALVAVVLPPLAPFWAWREKMKSRARIWIGAVVLYAAALVLAYT